MQKESRTAKSLKNSSVALIFYFINLILQFFSRKIFLDYLGTEILGLNTTATNLLQFLNLAELGIGTAVGFSLYKPFYDKDIQVINEIVALQGKLYRRIAYIVIAGSAVLMCFFPLIFAKMKLPLWYAYASFGVLLFSALLSYFVNYKQVLLSADQKGYKIQYSYKASMSVKTLVQILAIRYLDHGYVWWLVLEVIFAIIASFVLHLTVKHTYPFVRHSELTYRELNEKYPTIQTKIKQLFVHKIAGFVLNQTSPLIIYSIASLTLVAMYGNYMLIMMGLVVLANALSNGLTASIGNLVAEGDLDKVLAVFDELFSIRFLITAIMCFGMFTLTQPFITLWIGNEYLLPTSTLALITGILFVLVLRYSVESFRDAFGLYSDVYAPLVEAALNLGLSIVLGHYYGLNGVLSGVLISLIIVVLGWKPIFLFGIKLKRGLKQYIVMYLKHFFLCSLVWIVCFKMLQWLPINPTASFFQFLLFALIDLVIFACTSGSVLVITRCGIKKLILRFYSREV